MIFGIGTDICDLERIETLYQKQHQRFAERLLTKAELELFEKAPNKVAFLGKRFALKEAISKALGTGIGENLSFHDIEITRQSGQRPTAVLYKEQFKHIKLHISVSDERNYAVAYAIAEQME